LRPILPPPGSHLTECSFRTIELPAEVDADKAEAAHRNGVLSVRFPKAEKHQPRRIAVKAS
jgi:HSP20 family protein